MLNQDAICNDYLNEALSNKNKLYSLINLAKNKHLNNICNGIENMAEKPLSDIDELSNNTDDIKDSLDNTADNLDYNDDAQSLAECLGLVVSDPSVDIPNLPTPGRKLRSALDSKLSEVTNLFDTMLDPFEKIIGEAISALENMIPQELIDKLLNFIQCLAGCPGAEGLPTQVEIETKLSEAGLDINNKVDFNSTGISGSVSSVPSLDQQSHYNNISGMMNEVKNKSKDILTKSPF